MGKHSGARCWVQHCKNQRKKAVAPGTSFHQFPVSNIERCRLWLQAVGYEDLVYLPVHSLKMRFVCSEHFAETDYSKTGVNPSLLFTAIPSKLPEGTIPLSEEIVAEWPPQLESERKLLRLEDQTDLFPQSRATVTDNSADKLLASAVSAGILQAGTPKMTNMTASEQEASAMEVVQPSVTSREGLPPLPKELLWNHLKENAGHGLIDGDVLLGFVVQRGSDLELVPVGPGHATMVASCIEELLSPACTVGTASTSSTLNGFGSIS